MLDILASTVDKTAEEVASVVTTDPSRLSGQKVFCAVLAANITRRAKVIGRKGP